MKKLLGELIDSRDLELQTGPFGTQLPASSYVEEGTPVINVRNIGYAELVEEKLEFVPEEVTRRLSQHIIRANDIVFGRKGAVDRHLYVNPEADGWMQGGDCIRLRSLTDKVNMRYLSYSFLSEYHRKWMLNQGGNKATMAALNHDVIRRIQVELPKRDVQDEIASVLSSYDELIENNRKRIKLLERAARLLYKEWFVRLRFPGHEGVKVKDGVPEGWGKSRFGALCTQVKQSVKPENLEPDTPYIGLEHIPRRALVLDTWGGAEDVTSNKFAYVENDILFGKIRPYFHKVGFAVNNGITSSDTIVIRPNEQHLWSLTLLVASSDYFVAVVSKSAKEGSKMPRADWKQMQAFPVHLPTEGVLARFNVTVQPMLALMKVLVKENIQLTRARDLLLPRLMSGRVRV